MTDNAVPGDSAYYGTARTFGAQAVRPDGSCGACSNCIANDNNERLIADAVRAGSGGEMIGPRRPCLRNPPQPLRQR